jgi:hypothetical protein
MLFQCSFGFEAHEAIQMPDVECRDFQSDAGRKEGLRGLMMTEEDGSQPVKKLEDFSVVVQQFY